MCDLCSDFINLLTYYESRITSNDTDNSALRKSEVEIAITYIHTWQQRQCMCCYRDVKNFERFNLIIQSIICLTVCQLKNIKTLLNTPPNSSNTITDENKSEKPATTSETPSSSTTEINKTKDEDWTLPEIEKLLIVISKTFLLNFPLYVAYKHGVQIRWDEISGEEAQTLSTFCDLHDTEVPAFLFKNVSLFCSSGGFTAMTLCFEQLNLPVATAHAITAAISNVKLWLNYRSIVQLFIPLRIKVLQYMCKLADQDLRSPATRSMADFMWAAIKDPLDSQITFDTEGLALAFKYFTSSTLTMRLAGMTQINAHINLFNEICTSETVAEVEVVGQKLADWLTENQIISHLFGPNLHVEVIKQSHIVLNFLAVENQITEEHINLIWQAAQLKHCSKPVYDILPSLVKNLAPRPAMHLYSLLCRLDPKEHTEQSIYITSALTKLIWSRDNTKQGGVGGGGCSGNGSEISSSNLLRETIVSSSENSVSIDGSNSDDDHQEDDSSDGRKSPIEVGSDSGAPPCKQPRHKTCCGETTDESTKVELDVSDEVDCEKLKDSIANIPIIDRRMMALQDGSSTEDCMEDEENYVSLRRKMRKRKKNRIGGKKHVQVIVETMSDGETHSDDVVGVNDSDCSDSHLQSTVLGHLHAEGTFIGDAHLIDLLSSAENDVSYSSPMSNKSEKNMADFDDVESPCEEELAQLTASAHCLASFTMPRNRRVRRGVSGGEASGSTNNSQPPSGGSGKSVRSSGNKTSGSEAASPTKERPPSASFKAIDVCQPGNTLLWDLLQDDKIGQLGESLAFETEKTLATLLCFHTDKYIRTKFIEGCLHNLASNKSVVVSLRLLPKLFASFQTNRTMDTHQVTMWAERQHKMMNNFFNNLKFYTNSSTNQNTAQILNQNGGLMYTHLSQVQVRLQFLTSVFSAMGSPDTFRLSLEHVDMLWSWLANDPECADCLFAWLQGQAKGGEQHALGVEAVQHLYLKKLPELKPEGISMVALGLFQQLCSLARLTVLHYDTPTDSSLDIVGMSHLWKIALKANNTDVSLAATQYINSFYMGQQLKLEKEFVEHCMKHLTQAAEDLNNSENQENALMCVQRALMLLKTHLETFRRRYAYHLRRWALEGKGIGSHSALRCEGPGPLIKIILQRGGMLDKSALHLYSTDLVADLKAEIAKWWENLQGGNPKVQSGGATAPVLGLILSEGPLRIITQGQEITSEYDERNLADVGFKDNQMVYVSLGGRGGRRRELLDHPSLQPPPPKDCLPTILLLQPQYFEQLFKLMQTLGDMKMPGKGGNSIPHTKAQLLSRRIWDILAMLPTNPNLLENFHKLFYYKNSMEINREQGDTKTCALTLQQLLDPNNLQKFMYSLYIVESLSKTNYLGSDYDSSINQPKSSPQKTKTKNQEEPIKMETNESDIIVVDDSQEKECKKSSDCEMKQAEKIDEKPETPVPWVEVFIKSGGLRHLFDIFMQGILQNGDEYVDNYNEWRQDCLANLLRILCLLGIEIKRDENVLTLSKVTEHMLDMMTAKPTLSRLSRILIDASLPINPNLVRTGFWGRTQVVHYTITLLVCFVHSSPEAKELLWSDTVYSDWLQRLILDDPEPAVRREVCAGLYKICLGNAKVCHDLIGPLLSKLVSFLPIAEKMTSQNQMQILSSTDEGKEPYGPACRDYFWLFCRLLDTVTTEMIKESLEDPQTCCIDIESLCRQVSKGILDREYLETRHGNQDDGLNGLLNLMTFLVKYDPPFKFSAEGQDFIEKIFDNLFELPSPENRQMPKCKSQTSRGGAYDLLGEMCRNSSTNYSLLHEKLLKQHRPGPHSPYPWDYWPRDDGRSECGYVGLTNLGATCYMASCIQHLYMMPQAKDAILRAPSQASQKHAPTLHELQRMFAYLMESERKSYNPRSFCRVYQMDHQPLNTGEQKDMAEFFIDLVSKLEEMTPDLKLLVKQLFCGVLSNNVVSLDCGHVSRTIEEFYTVRCQVADMRNLFESLDEVTVKDTLEGDNMYTCSQCGRKVRAEKRACFKKLPQILCFNTMRYTFNMVTMLKEKVNTHFSFPMRLDMLGYVEKTLMPQQYEEGKMKSQQRSARSVSESENNPNLTNASDDEPKNLKKTESDETSEKEKDEEKSKLQSPVEEDDVDEFSEYYEYDLVGVTVHTGTADGGHYYSFIKERTSTGEHTDRWFLFNDAEVKIFDPSQIAAECFGGEMTSKTYDSVTEKYLDFSFEKTNSAYMLFYERRTENTDKQINCDISPTTSESIEVPSCSGQQQQQLIVESDSLQEAKNQINLNEDKINNKLFSNQNETEVKGDLLLKNNLSITNCDIDFKSTSNTKLKNNPSSSSSSLKEALLSKELEEWIWQDNRHFLQDRNIFEHTYFNFMWQICGQLPQTLLQPDITSIAAQLSVSFFLETFIHAKEKPTMVLWVELLTKQFNGSQEACEWFLTHMSTEPWWPVQVLIQCPNQMVRQMFQRLVIHVIQRLRSSHSTLYLKIETDEEGKEVAGNSSCVTRFIKSLILLLEHGAKAHLKHLSEFFGLLYEFSRMGEEETVFLLRINVIRSVADFYLGHKITTECMDKNSDNDDNSSEDELTGIPVDKTRPASLDKMIALVASLVERSRGSDLRLHLSPKDYSAIAGGKGFPFLYQQIKDNINPHQTRHLIHALCRWDERLANQIITMLFSAVTKHTELCGPFFKLLTLLTESSGGPSGLPCFSQLVLQRVWDAAEYCPQSALDWLAVQAPRNKIAHAWILQSTDSWVEQFLLAHNNSRVRNAAAYLLVSLVPSQSFRANYRAHHKMSLHTAQRELNGDAQIVLNTILTLLLRLLRPARAYTDITVHGTTKLTAYFTLMTYCMVTKNEKQMLGQHLKVLWELFHPRLSEPSVPVHHNKQALLVFWHHATNDCPENALLIANCPDITRNIAFNYILADHDDSEIVGYNRAMLPAYYGLLRLCCQQSRTLTRQLAAHQNLQWAFKNITPHPTQYAMAVDELFRLMTLFAARHADSTEGEQREISTFRKTTLLAYLGGLDSRVSWGTLIAALRILVDSDEDRLFVVYNGGIAMAFEALHTLHSMYHEATACHVSGDLQELLTELVLLVSVLRNREQKKRPPNAALKGLTEAVRRLATLLNTFNPPEMRNLCLEVLKELVKNSYTEVTNVLVPLLSHCHITAQTTPHTIAPLGPYFPRRGSKGWSTVTKNTPRPPRPMVQMCLPQAQIIQKNVDKDVDAGMEAFYKPYHDFLDVMFRMAVNTNQLNESLVNLSCLAGLEAATLHFNLFPKFWVGVHNNVNTNKYVELLINNPFLVQYIDVILKDERISLNDPIILNFAEIYYSKVTSRLVIPRLIDSICQLLPSKENLLDLCGDLNAIRIIAQSTGIPPSVHKLLKTCLQTIVNRYKDLFGNEEESPPKKRKISEAVTDPISIAEDMKIIEEVKVIVEEEVVVTPTETTETVITTEPPQPEPEKSKAEEENVKKDENVDIEMVNIEIPTNIATDTSTITVNDTTTAPTTSTITTATTTDNPLASGSKTETILEDNKCLHKDIESNIEKILGCFSDEQDKKVGMVEESPSQE